MNIAANQNQGMTTTEILHNQGFTSWRNEIERTYQRVNYQIQLKKQTNQKVKMIDQMIRQASADILRLKKRQKSLRTFQLHSQRNERLIHSRAHSFMNCQSFSFNEVMQNYTLHRQMRELDTRITTLECKVDKGQKKKKDAQILLEREVHLWTQETNISCLVHSKNVFLPFTLCQQTSDHAKMIAKKHFLNKGTCSNETSINGRLYCFLQQHSFNLCEK